MIRSLPTILIRLDQERAARVAGVETMVAEVRSRLPLVAEELRTTFGATRVLLFGSFAGGTPSGRSDVDLAVEGLPARDHFRAMAFATRIIDRSVDLVRLEDLDPEDREILLLDAESL